MGSSQSSKIHCNRYLDQQGPPSLAQQASEGLESASGGGGGGGASPQPLGQMTWVVLDQQLPSFPNDSTVELSYTFPDGIQSEGHPHPGEPYAGGQISAYLPDNREGRQLLKLLEKAFYKQLLFTVAPGPDGGDTVAPAFAQLEAAGTQDGYPDSEYLRSVRKLLKEKGTGSRRSHKSSRSFSKTSASP